MTRSLIRWAPEHDLFRRGVARLFDDAFNDFLAPLATGETTDRTWRPAVDVKETEEGLTLLAELPGLAKEDVEVTVEDNVLTLRGERPFARNEETDNYHRVERAYGSFSRSFTLPKHFDASAVSAKFESGLLTLSIPKTEEAQPKKITIG